jgi:MFS family permease
LTADAPARVDTARFPGWRVVGGAFVVLAVTAGLGFYNLSVYLTALKDEHGFSEGSLGVATAFFFAIGGVAGVGIGNLMGRYDARRIIIVGAVLGSVALLLLGRVTELWQVFAVYGVFALGFGCAGIVPCTTLVTRWFHRRRAIALAIASTGLSVGGIAFTPLSETMIDRWGLRDATPWFAVAWFVVIVPVTLTTLLPDPVPLGFHPYDDPRPLPAGKATGIRWEEARRTRFFLAVTSAYVLVMGAQVGGIAHLFNLVKIRVDSNTAALAVSAVAASSVLARLAGGVIASRWNMRLFTIGCCGLQAAGLVLLANLDGRLPLLLASVVFGASVGNLLMMQSVLIADAFGSADYPRIYARTQLFTTIGLVLGPSLVGILEDATDSYTLSFLLAAVGSVAGGLILLTWAQEPAGTAPEPAVSS